MIDRRAIRDSAVQAIINACTDADEAVYSPRTWPMAPGSYPHIIVRTQHENRQNISPRMGPPEFDSTITITAVGRVSATTEDQAEEALEDLSSQIELALLTNGQFIYDNNIQQFSSVNTSMEVRSDSELHYGETVVSFNVEVRQVFEPVIDAAGVFIGPTLEDVDIVIQDRDSGKHLAEIDISTGA